MLRLTSGPKWPICLFRLRRPPQATAAASPSMQRISAFLNLLFLSGLALLPQSAVALDPAKSVYQFNTRSWTRHDGLPGNKVNSITQTADGYLWIGTQNGLVRFDGIDFTVIPVELPQARGQDVKMLAPSATGGVWFAIGEGGFGHYDGHHFAPIPDPRWNQPGSRARAVLESRDGVLWTGCDEEFGRWVTRAPEKSTFKSNGAHVIAFCEDSAGTMWIGTEYEGLQRWSHDRLERLSDPQFANHVIRSLAADRQGWIWMATERGLLRYNPRTGEKSLNTTYLPITAVLVDRHDVVWAGTTHGLLRVQGDAITVFGKNDGLGSDYVTALCEDREGSLWIGTQDGLNQLSDVKFPIFSQEEGLNQGGGLDVAASHRGGVWITTTAGFSYYDGKGFTRYTDPKLLPNPYIKLGYEARNGDFYWVDGDRNLSVLTNGKLSARYANSQWIEALGEDDQSVVAALGATLVRIRHGRLEPLAYKNGRAPDFLWIDNLAITRDGAIWVASYKGVFRIKDGEFRQWSTAQGLPGERAHLIVEDENSTIWVGLATGIARIRDGEVRGITTASGLFDNRTYGLAPDDHGWFWVNSGRGIYRVTRRALNAFADGTTTRVECEPFDGEDSVKFTDRIDQEFAACRSRDGRIWFPNPSGVVMIDPANFVVNRVAPMVHIERIKVNGDDLPATASGRLQLTGGRVEFFFSALSFVSPKRIRLRYQLEGVDPAWVDAVGRRSANYQLKPGRYTFRVQAANADGVWNSIGETRELEFPPSFYQTSWFYALCALAAAGGAFAIYRWKITRIRQNERKLQRQNQLLESRVAERTQELEKSFALLTATIESSADGILVTDLSGRIRLHNAKFAALWTPASGALPDGVAELRAQIAPLMKHPDDFLARAAQRENELVAGGVDQVELQDGRTFERLCSPQLVDGKPVGTVIHWRDVTARLRAEAAIAEASGLLDVLLANTVDLVYFKDTESRYIRYSASLERLFDSAKPGELKGKTDFDYNPAERARPAYEDEQAILRTGRPLIAKLEPNVRPRGDVQWLLTTKIPWRDHTGAIVGTFGISRDVTAIKAAEAQLASERDLLRSLLDSTPDQIYFKDRESRFLLASTAQAVKCKLASAEELVGKSDLDFYSAAHATEARADEVAIIHTGQPLIGKVERETWLNSPDTWVLTSKMPLRDHTGEIIGTIGISKDITSLKEAEAKLEELHKQLIDTSRQAGMAEVATSVLHNVGNVLNSVNVSATVVTERMRDSKVGHLAKVAALLRARADDLGSFFAHDPKGQKLPEFLTLLSDELAGEQAEMAEELQNLRKNIDHIKEIVAMQQSYAKISGLTDTVALADIIEDALRINSGALRRHDVALIRDFQAQPILTVERHKVLQILVNLIRNAKYACDESGRADKQVTLRLLRDATSARIEVIDNGVGIAAENLTRIFSHGFTTRKEGHGFGLHSGSLAAKELGGALTVRSDGPGHGAVFTLELPLTAENPQG